MNLNSIVQEIQLERQQQATGKPVALTSGASTSSTSSAGSTGDATITADDFLTLLVSELQNQDPTSDTDPNEYVDQLVDVNSLQQLISINQEVGDLAPSSGASGNGDSSDVASAATSPTSLTNPNGSSAPLATTASAQAAHARAGYSALEPPQSSASSVPGSALRQHSAGQVFDPANPAAASHRAPVNTAVPLAWQPGTEARP